MLKDLHLVGVDDGEIAEGERVGDGLDAALLQELQGDDLDHWGELYHAEQAESTAWSPYLAFQS